MSFPTAMFRYTRLGTKSTADNIDVRISDFKSPSMNRHFKQCTTHSESCIFVMHC